MGDRVILKAAEGEEQTKSGIYIPDTAKEKPNEGTIIAVGPGRTTPEGKLLPLDIKVGDTVIYSKFSGVEYTEDGEDYLILSADRDILAKIG
jgi:chaperonin GroES